MHRRAILHSDINCCYAQIECQAHPDLRDKPVVVGGEESARHGIVLAKNMLAKKRGIKTAETLRDARRKCPGLVVVPPDYRLYLRASSLARHIYYDYTDLVEPFGPDEAWLDVTGSTKCLGLTPHQIACEISERMKADLGITVSVGVSWNKIFAKFGSDYEKPDAVTLVTPENYRDLVWKAPVGELLYVGAATEAKLRASGIATIGDLAHAGDYYLQNRLGKMGFVLRDFALGGDATEVKPLDLASCDVARDVKSYGNGITFPRDIADMRTAKAVVWMLAESVTQRMREGRARCRTVSVGFRRAGDLSGFTRQAPTALPTNITAEVAHCAWELFRANAGDLQEEPLRAIHVRAGRIVPAADELQLSLFDPMPRRAEMERLDAAIDELRRRFGNKCVVWGPQALDADAWANDAHGNVVHPVSFFHR